MNGTERNQFHNLDVLVEHLCLVNISRNTIQNEDRTVGVQGSGMDELVDMLSPEAYRKIVRNQLALAGVPQKNLPNLAIKVNGSKYVAASEVVEARQDPQHFALRAFAAAGGTKQQNRFDFFHVARLSFLVQQLIPIIPLMRLVAEFPDQPLHRFLVEAEGGAGRETTFSSIITLP